MKTKKLVGIPFAGLNTLSLVKDDSRVGLWEKQPWPREGCWKESGTSSPHKNKTFELPYLFVQYNFENLV